MLMSLEDRREYADLCAARAREDSRSDESRRAWMREAERVAADVRFFVDARRRDGYPYPRWAIDFAP